MVEGAFGLSLWAQVWHIKILAGNSLIKVLFAHGLAYAGMNKCTRGKRSIGMWKVWHPSKVSNKDQFFGHDRKIGEGTCWPQLNIPKLSIDKHNNHCALKRETKVHSLTYLNSWPRNLCINRAILCCSGCSTFPTVYFSGRLRNFAGRQRWTSFLTRRSIIVVLWFI